jgi:hypothetical protein
MMIPVPLHNFEETAEEWVSGAGAWRLESAGQLFPLFARKHNLIVALLNVAVPTLSFGVWVRNGRSGCWPDL